MSGPLTAGTAVSLLSAKAIDLDSADYEEAEYKVAGTATSYQADDLPTNGRYELRAADKADYATRIVVRRPKDDAKFNGTVVVEWLNVSSGADAAPDFAYMAPELLRNGYAWVGVSAQQIGIEGGAVAVSTPVSGAAGAGKGIKAIDPARYGDLKHPGDAFSYDMFTQVARALRSPGKVDALGGLKPKTVLAIGESQSAFTLTTYADGVQPLTHVFDGFLIHSRGGAPAPLGETGKGIDIAGSLSGKATIIRTDLDVPTIMVETETDVLGLLGYLPARQPDSAHVRLWEVAGTAHADRFQIGDVEALLGCPSPINNGQQTFPLRAALHDLNSWAQGGAAPPEAPRLQIDESGAKPVYAKDENGNVKGGVRTPAVDAPTQVLSGIAPEGASIICLLLGTTEPLPADRLAALYPSPGDYQAAYAKAADEAIKAGFVLADDRPELIADARPPTP